MERTGTHIILRPAGPSDIEQILTWGHGSKESFFTLNYPFLFNREDLMRDLATRTTELSIVEARGNNEPQGLIKLGPTHSTDKHSQLRFTVDTFRHYSAEAALEGPRFVLENAFQEKTIHKIFAYALEYEKEYRSLLLKLGFKQEGAYQHHFYYKERYYAVLIFGLTEGDFIR